MIDAAIRPLLDDPAIVCATLKSLIIDPEELKNPNAVKVVTDSDGFALYFSRSRIPFQRSDKKAASYKHIGLYVYRRDFLEVFSKLKPTPLELSEELEQLRMLENGYRIKVIETPFNPISVDTEEDLQSVREIAQT
jgi:3-deoxy-manno-octulosonate cytidylyltransferase (CMP-KDO synthetase)